MKLIRFFYASIRFLLAIAGVVYLYKKINQDNKIGDYKFEVDSLYENEDDTSQFQYSPKAKQTIQDLFETLNDDEPVKV